ncbi:MAG: hypothetical protein GVY10_07735 [Verrucomicrobia bacterium]|jgi:hypothetical protein|nr:hypothetical protein [Verrucomicrobiota bacterium]
MDLQRDWYSEMIDYMGNTVGCRQLLTASNWKTSDDSFLLEAEYFTYTAADIINTHNYFSPQISNAAIFNSNDPQVGHRVSMRVSWDRY